MKKLLVILLVMSMMLSAAGVLADGIGSPDAPVKVVILEKDVLPTEEDVQLMIEAVEKGMAAEGNYVDLEYLEAPAGKYVDVVPLALRTGQIAADIVYFQNGVELELAQEGMLADLTEYVNNSTNVKALYKDYNWARLEKFPYLLWLCPAFTYTANVRTDILNQLDCKDTFLADPTVENFHALLKEIKDKGLAEYPLTTDNNKLRLDGFMNQAFGITGTVMNVDGKYVFAEVTEGSKAKLKFLHQLYEEGLFDHEFLTNTWDVMEQRYYEGIAQIISGRVGATTKIYDDKMVATHGEGATLTILPPLKGVGQAYAAVDVIREPRGFAIMEDSEVKDAAFAVFEFICSPAGREIDLLGIEGKHFVKAEDGTVTTTEKWPEWWNRFFESTDNLQPAELVSSLYSDAVLKSVEMANEYYAEDTYGVLTPEDLITQKDAMNNIYNEYYADFITGQRDIDAEWDNFVSEWNANGGDEFSEYFDSIF